MEGLPYKLHFHILTKGIFIYRGSFILRLCPTGKQLTAGFLQELRKWDRRCRALHASQNTQCK
jgi:hypothetical protein